MATKQRGLGRGLGALIDDFSAASAEDTITKLPLQKVEPNPNQPRRSFDEVELQALADSIAEHGILQPLAVRALDGGFYQIIAGERRWRAARMAGLEEVPVVVLEADDRTVMELALIENLQRKDLNVIEEALGYQQLMDKYDMTQEKVAERVGKSRPAVANALRLLNLPDQVIDMVKSGEVTAGHARALLKLEDQSEIIEIAKKIQKGRYSVRDVEKITKKKLELPKNQTKNDEGYHQDSFFKEMELALATDLGRKVKVTVSEKENGSLEIAFFSKEDLGDIAAKLTGNKW